MSLCCYADNFITNESLIVPSSLVPVQNPAHIEKFAAGSATMELSGTYSDVQNRDYVVLISYADNVAAVYRYDWSDQGGATGTWNAVNVPIVPSVWQTLNNGLQIRFLAGPYTPQLLVTDRFRFHIERPNRPGLAIDLDRESELRSGALGAGAFYNLTFPFLAPVTPRALILFDFNGPSGTTLALQASTTSNFATTPYSQIVPWAAGKICFRIVGTQTYRYWRLLIQVASAMNYISMSGLYLGSELLFSKEMDQGFEQVNDLFGASDEGVLARGQGRYGIKPRRWAMTFGYRTPADDLAKFDTLLALTRPKTHSMRPLYLVFDSVPGLEIFELMHIVGAVRRQHQMRERVTASADLLEVVRTAA